MATEKMTDQAFSAKVLPLLMGDRTPTFKELAEATGLSIGGVRYKMSKIGVKRTNKFLVETNK
jgi:hypothetical protein